jgi:hypothetical protein
MHACAWTHTQRTRRVPTRTVFHTQRQSCPAWDAGQQGCICVLEQKCARAVHVRRTITRVKSPLHLCQWGRASAGSKHADATLTLSKLGCSRPRRCVRICRTQYELPIRQHLGECCSATCVSVRQENGQDIDVTWFPLPGCRCCSAICFECECCVPGTQADTAVEHVETGPLKATRYLLLAGAGSLPIPPGRFGCF